MIVLEKLEDLEEYYNKKAETYIFRESIIIVFDVKLNASLKVSGNINALNIDAFNIDALDIYAWNIDANNIDARDINARDIKARDINANDIDAWDIKAWNINAMDIDALNINAIDINTRNISARDINANNIDARDIEYFAFAVAYKSFKCVSATAGRKNGIALCLDQPIFYKDKENK